MSGYLLDTHVVVWLAVEPDRVPRRLRDLLAGARRVCVSAASVYELAQKVRLGRLPEAASLLARWSELLDSMLAADLQLSSSDMALAGSMPWEHRDPFDRMLVAQSQLHGLQLVTKDAAILAFPQVNCAPWE